MISKIIRRYLIRLISKEYPVYNYTLLAIFEYLNADENVNCFMLFYVNLLLLISNSNLLHLAILNILCPVHK